MRGKRAMGSEVTGLSKCCGSRATVSDPLPDFPGDDQETMRTGTCHFVCTKCGEACDLNFVKKRARMKFRFWSDWSGVFDWTDARLTLFTVQWTTDVDFWGFKVTVCNFTLSWYLRHEISAL